MPNRNLTPEELLKANRLLNEIRTRLEELSEGDLHLRFAYRRKIAKELTYDERGKPMQRKLLKLKKMVEQKGLCAICLKPLPETHSVLDRLNAIGGYTMENTRLIHSECDIQNQASRGYQ